MSEQSKTVKAAVARLYAAMAEAAAKRVMRRIDCDDAERAEFWALKVEKYLSKSSAEAVKWHYSHPSVL
jgi:hypothetical protein